MKNQVETIEQFYQRSQAPVPADFLNSGMQSGHFNVRRRSHLNRRTPYNRRDHYKICLTYGLGRLHMEGKTIDIDQPAICFTNPGVTLAWESISDQQDGYYCLFNEAFISAEFKRGLEKLSPLFNPFLEPVYLLNQEDALRLNQLFAQLEEELTRDYIYKFEVIRTILKLIIHEGIRMQSHKTTTTDKTASDRITPVFLELLERQFPVDSPENPLKLKRASEFATQLNIHVNHLNYIVKSHTGKTTTQVISNRIIDEAKTLLKNTDWDVAEIGYCLGFEYPAHFNTYFKKNTGQTPLLYKQQC